MTPDALIGAGAVALGAALGGPARFFVSGLIARRFGETFPWGTLVVNASGALLIGLIAAYAQARGLSSQSSFSLFFITGILGGYTTVSSFSLQSLALAREGESLPALGNVVLSLLLCIAATASGLAIGALVFASAKA